jgi:serine protease Do
MQVADGSSIASGTGFFIRADGIICTAAHVVLKNGAAPQQIAQEIYVHVYPENIIVRANVIGIDRLYDVAILKVPLTGRQFFPWRNSRDVKSGEFAITIGQPYGQHVQSVTYGVVRDNKWHDDSGIPESVVVDFHTIGGNSGGPVIDVDGNVIAILSWGLQNVSAGYDFSLNGSVASFVAEKVADYVLQRYDLEGQSLTLRTYPTKYLGVTYYPFDMFEQRLKGTAMNLPVSGFILKHISSGTPAAAAGLAVGDVILEANGVTMGQNNNQYPLGTITHFSEQNPLTLRVRKVNGSVVTVGPIALANLPSSLDVIFSPLQNYKRDLK